MSITIQDLFNQIPSDKIKFQLVQNSLIGVNKSTGKKPASLQIAIPDEVATDFFMATIGRQSAEVGLLVMIDRESFDKAKTELGIGGESHG